MGEIKNEMKLPADFPSPQGFKSQEEALAFVRQHAERNAHRSAKPGMTAAQYSQVLKDKWGKR